MKAAPSLRSLHLSLLLGIGMVVALLLLPLKVLAMRPEQVDVATVQGAGSVLLEEGFEGLEGDLPPDWQAYYLHSSWGEGTWDISESEAHSGTASAHSLGTNDCHRDCFDHREQWLRMPAIALPSEGVSLEYWELGGAQTEILICSATTECDNPPAGYTSLALGGGPGEWQHKRLLISHYRGQMAYVAFRHVIPSEVTDEWYVDDVTVSAYPVPSVAFTKTVGLTEDECDAQPLYVRPGTEVTYCFTLTNTSSITLSHHTLQDSHLGRVLSDYSYLLAPSASLVLTRTDTVTESVTGVATWTATSILSDSVVASSTTQVNDHLRVLLPVVHRSLPSWLIESHDQIAFEREGRLVVSSMDGAHQLDLGEGASPAWSPDGAQIAFESVSGWETNIFVTTLGGWRRQLTSYLEYEWGSSANPAWSPTARIAYDFTQCDHTGCLPFQIIQSMNAAGGEEQVLLGNIDEYYAEPSWSPDGTRLAVVRNQSEIQLLTLASGDTAPLLSQAGDKAGPVWSPDGTQIVFAANADGDWEIYVVNSDGVNLRQLTDNAANDREPVWSPDGSRLAFASDREGGNWDIYLMRADGTDVTRFTSGAEAERAPSWRP